MQINIKDATYASNAFTIKGAKLVIKRPDGGQFFDVEVGLTLGQQGEGADAFRYVYFTGSLNANPGFPLGPTGLALKGGDAMLGYNATRTGSPANGTYAGRLGPTIGLVSPSPKFAVDGTLTIEFEYGSAGLILGLNGTLKVTLLDAVTGSLAVSSSYDVTKGTLDISGSMNVMVPKNGNVLNANSNLDIKMGQSEPGGFSFKGNYNGTFLTIGSSHGAFNGNVGYNGAGTGFAKGNFSYQMSKEAKTPYDYQLGGSGDGSETDGYVQVRFGWNVNLNGNIDASLNEDGLQGKTGVAGTVAANGGVRVWVAGWYGWYDAGVTASIAGSGGTPLATIAYGSATGFEAQGRVSLKWDLPSLVPKYKVVEVYAEGNVNVPSSLSLGGNVY